MKTNNVREAYKKAASARLSELSCLESQGLIYLLVDHHEAHCKELWQQDLNIIENAASGVLADVAAQRQREREKQFINLNDIPKLPKKESEAQNVS